MTSVRLSPGRTCREGWPDYQNGKLFERIDTDYTTNSFTLNTSAMVNLLTCTTPNGFPCEAPGIRPDNAPICPIIDFTSRYVFVTLRGGGLFVVDATTTPMEIVAEYDIDTVHPNGCLGVHSGGGTASPCSALISMHSP